MTPPSRVRERVPLAGLTTFGIGGPARYLAEPRTRGELASCLAFAHRSGLPVLVLGGGSNLLVADAGVEALVLRLSAEGEFGMLEQRADDPLSWRVGAAAPLPALVAATAERGVAGLESLAGIPGTAGGAAAMNCGGGEGGFGTWIEEAEVYDSAGTPHILRPPELRFFYRGSTLGGSLAAVFAMRFPGREDAAALLARLREHRERKRETQPLSLPSAGCVFKNPPGHSAGLLLDRAGCKDMREGDAGVSSRHANFIVNLGKAGSRDVAALAGRMRKAVAESAGIVLEPEIILWGDEPAFAALKALREGAAP